MTDVIVSLGDVATVPVEQTTPTHDFIYVDISSIDRDSKQIVNAKEIAAAEAPSRARQVLQAGDVLVSMTRPNLNAVALVPSHLHGAIASTGLHVLRSSWVKPSFLFGLVQTDAFIDAMCKVVQGALYPAVRPKDISSFKFILQSPNQQIRIIEKLEGLLTDLNAGFSELKAAQKKLSQYRQSLLKSAVEGVLTAEWREHLSPSMGEDWESGELLLQRVLSERRSHWEAKQLAKFAEQGKAPNNDWQKKYQEPVLPDTNDLPDLPKGWTWASLDMLGEIASGVAKGTKHDADVEVHEVPYLRVANVQRGFLDLSEVKTIMATQRDITALTLQAGDILFNEGGDRDKLGRGWVWRNEVANCIHQNHVFRMRPYLPEVLPELISHHGNTFGKTWFQNAGKQTTNLASINMKMLRMFPVPLGPALEQKEILIQLESQMENFNRQEQSIELGIKQSAAQRKNILKAAFSGQLVQQDPSDELSTVLLERIRAEWIAREAQPKARKTKQQKEIVAVVNQLIDVLADAGTWMSAEEAFRRCGISDGAQTDQLEALYAELRALDKAGRLAVEPVMDAQGRKSHDRLKLLVV